MKYAALNRTHADVDLDAIGRARDLFEGGERFRKNVATYLPQHDVEPPQVYKRRCAGAYYLNYCARVVNFFASALMACPPTLKSEPEAVDAWWEEFREDADGRGTDLVMLARDFLVRALVAQRAYLRVEFPAAGELPAGATVADADRSGARAARLVGVPTEQVTHWLRRPDGSFAWVLEHERREELLDLDDDAATITETWTQWYADGSARRWQIAYSAKSKPTSSTDVDEVEAPANPCGAIPLVELSLKPELCVLTHVADAAVEHFRKSNALSWAIDRTCYAMPWFFLKSAKKPPTMGTGFYGILGVDEKIEWPTPPSAPFEVIRTNVADLVQEIHRVAEQMALAVDNNAAAAVGRSGESKAADHEATETVLRAYGQALRDPLERALDLVARGRGETIDWDVSGMDVYDLADAKMLTEMALATEPLQIPSVTHRREVFKAVSRAQLPHLDEFTRQQIEREINAGTNAEDTRRDSTIPPPGGRDSSVPPGADDGADDGPKIPKAPRVPQDMK
jgi:hypothetical protein